jgi:hypothetical protein
LPIPPPGIYNCPVDFGVYYQMVFSDDAATVMVVTATPGGCRFLSAMNGSVSAGFVATEGYWKTLAGDLGIDEVVIYPYSPPAN